MKKIFILFFILTTNIWLCAQSDYYWYKGEKIALEKVQNKKYFLIESIEDPASLLKILNMPNAKVLKFGKTDISGILHAFKQTVIKTNISVIIEDSMIANVNLSAHEEILYESNFYLTPNNVEVGLSYLFDVRLNNADDLGKLEKMAFENNVKILGNNRLRPLSYILSCSKESNGDALKMANLFYESNLFSSSQPDLMPDDPPASCVDDTYFTDQWGLSNTGQYDTCEDDVDINYCQSREYTTGNQNIVVAVVDQGFEMDHPDLTNIYAYSYDSTTGTDSAWVRGRHGTAVAGIIGANSNNSIGIAGIAPDCPLMSISNSLAPNDELSVIKRADGIEKAWQNGASVINCSWVSSIEHVDITDAIDNALTLGRNKKGCVVVFAAGNDGSGISYPANSNDDIIVVGAISPCGNKKTSETCDTETEWGSNYGPDLDIMAPGVLVPTTDMQGTSGYNTSFEAHLEAGGELVANDYADNDYTIWFNGTSAAAPHVSAVAALILSIDPDLTQAEVSEIIESTAQKTGDYTYTPSYPNGSWSGSMGYGTVDAYAALELACTEHQIIDFLVILDLTYEACDFYLENVSVTKNAKLTLNALHDVLIDGPFEVELGCQLEINSN